MGNISFGPSKYKTDNNPFNAGCLNLLFCLNLSNLFIRAKKEEFLEWRKNIVRYS